MIRSFRGKAEAEDAMYCPCQCLVRGEGYSNLLALELGQKSE